MPALRPRLVACDLDGTLLGPELVFSPSIRRGVATLRAAGVRVVICTGRMFSSARPRAAELGLRDGPIICYGGALVADLESGAWLRHEPIDGDVAAALVRFARERDLHVNAYVDDLLHVETDDRWTRWTVGYAKVDVTLVDDLMPVVERGPTKLVIAADPNVAAEIALEVARASRAGCVPPPRSHISSRSTPPLKARPARWSGCGPSLGMCPRTAPSPVATVSTTSTCLRGRRSGWRWRKAPKARAGQRASSCRGRVWAALFEDLAAVSE